MQDQRRIGADDGPGGITGWPPCGRRVDGLVATGPYPGGMAARQMRPSHLTRRLGTANRLYVRGRVLMQSSLPTVGRCALSDQLDDCALHLVADAVGPIFRPGHFL